MNLPLGEQIRNLRLRKYRTQTALADASGIAGSLISQIERGRIQPTVRTILRILEFTGGEIVLHGGDAVPPPIRTLAQAKDYAERSLELLDNARVTCAAAHEAYRLMLNAELESLPEA